MSCFSWDFGGRLGLFLYGLMEGVLELVVLNQVLQEKPWFDLNTGFLQEGIAYSFGF